MEEADKLRLSKNFKYIVDNLRIKDVEDELYQNEVINSEDMQHIRAKVTEQDRVRYVLEILPYKGPLGYSNFRAALEEQYQHIGKKLDDTNVAALMGAQRKKRIKPLVTDWFTVSEIIAQDPRCLRQWMIVGRALGLKEYMITSIDYDYRSGGVREMVHQVLQQWISMTGQRATTMYCAQVLRERGFESVADKIMGYE